MATSPKLPDEAWEAKLNELIEAAKTAGSRSWVFGAVTFILGMALSAVVAFFLVKFNETRESVERLEERAEKTATRSDAVLREAAEAKGQIETVKQNAIKDVASLKKDFETTSLALRRQAETISANADKMEKRLGVVSANLAKLEKDLKEKKFLVRLDQVEDRTKIISTNTDRMKKHLDVVSADLAKLEKNLMKYTRFDIVLGSSKRFLDINVDVPARFRVFQKKDGFATEEIVLPIEFPDGVAGAWVSPFKNSDVFGRWRLLQVRVEGRRLSLLSNAPGNAGGMGLTIHVLYHGRAPK